MGGLARWCWTACPLQDGTGCMAVEATDTSILPRAVARHVVCAVPGSRCSLREMQPVWVVGRADTVPCGTFRAGGAGNGARLARSWPSVSLFRQPRFPSGGSSYRRSGAGPARIPAPWRRRCAATDERPAGLEPHRAPRDGDVRRGVVLVSSPLSRCPPRTARAAPSCRPCPPS